MNARDRFVTRGLTCRVDGAPAPVANVSVGGLFLASEMPVFAGQFIELELELEGRRPFRVNGKVTWINGAETPAAPGLPRGFGVQITRIGMEDKLALVDLLKRRGAGASSSDG